MGRKRGRAYVSVVCAVCSKPFQRLESEARRCLERGLKSYCSKQCLGKNMSIHLGNYLGDRKSPYLRRGSSIGDGVDELSPFRKFLHSIKNRFVEKGKSYTVTEIDLKKVWDDQKGICPLTGWNLILPRTSTGFERADIKNASVDRMDNTQGYDTDNIRFISVMANICRGTFSDEQVKEFCIAVAGRHPPGPPL